MTYKKKTSIALTIAALLSATTASANDAPAPFATLDTDANGVVNFSEYTVDAKIRNQDLVSAMRKFNVISGGEQTFNQDQYATAFAVQGEVVARDTDKTVIMPIQATDVMGAVATGIVVDELDADIETSSEIEDALIVDTQLPEDDVANETASLEIESESNTNASVGNSDEYSTDWSKPEMPDMPSLDDSELDITESDIDVDVDAEVDMDADIK